MEMVQINYLKKQEKVYSIQDTQTSTQTAIDKVRQHGYFHDLVQNVGVSFHHSESAAISDLFLWDENDVSKLNSLALPGNRSNDISEKKHHHLCELFNVAYTLALKQKILYQRARDVSGS